MPDVIEEDLDAQPSADPSALEDTDLERPEDAAITRKIVDIHDAIALLVPKLGVGAAVYGIDKSLLAGKTGEDVKASLAQIKRSAEYFRDAIPALLQKHFGDAVVLKPAA